MGISASCACGAVALKAAISSSVIHCHCQLCRRLSGCAFTTWVSVAKASLQLQGEAALSTYSASESTVRHFCRHCGTHLYTCDQRMSDIVGVPAGIIADGAKLQASAHYFVDHQAQWHVIHDDLPCFGGESGYEPHEK